MPIENERKYILTLGLDDIDKLADDYYGDILYIQQAYIKDGRIRKITKHINQDVSYIFTWKARRPDNSRVEIEKKISQDDFDDLWDLAEAFITKTRVKIKGFGMTWDVDFLVQGNDHYITVAEVEMPEGLVEPKVLPPFVKDNLVYAIPLDKDRDWTNPKLTDPEKVAEMLKEAAGWSYG